MISTLTIGDKDGIPYLMESGITAEVEVANFAFRDWMNGLLADADQTEIALRSAYPLASDISLSYYFTRAGSRGLWAVLHVAWNRETGTRHEALPRLGNRLRAGAPMEPVVDLDTWVTSLPQDPVPSVLSFPESIVKRPLPVPWQRRRWTGGR